MFKKKYKVGDTFYPIDRPDIDFKITSKRGAAAMNKHQPITYGDMKYFSQPKKKSGKKDSWFS